MGVGPRKPSVDQALDQGLVEIGPDARAIEDEIGVDRLRGARAAPQDVELVAVWCPLEVCRRTADQNRTASIELGHQPRVNLDRQAMAMCVEERAKMPEEACLLDDRKRPPDVL